MQTFEEITYTLPTGDEIMVQHDGDTHEPLDVYAYTDIARQYVAIFDGGKERNSLFIHAADPVKAWQALSQIAIFDDDQV